MSDLACLDLDQLDDAAVVTLNRPEARNPTSVPLLDALDAALDRAVAARARVVLLEGAGRVFCAGLDLEEIRSGEETVHRSLTRLGETMRRLRRLDAVTIAVVRRAAIGGGFGFMAASDFAVTHPEAKIGYPPAALGLSPALMAPWLMRKIGASPARAMLLAGGTIDGAEAHRRGIATHLVAEPELDGTALALARELLGAPEHALRAMKGFLNELDGSDEDEALDLAARVSAEVIAHPETQARLAVLRSDRR